MKLVISKVLYTGPYTVTEIGATDNITILSNIFKNQVVHKDMLKFFFLNQYTLFINIQLWPT